MKEHKTLDIIWNISQICPWDCEFCCTDAVHVSSTSWGIIARERSLSSHRRISKGLSQQYKELYPNVAPSKFDLALLDRQLRGIEPTYEEKLKVLQNLRGYSVKIDFAGGEPLACYENYLVIKKACEIFGRDAISITSTGAFVRRYGIRTIANLVGQYEFTYDEPEACPQDSRPMGYNATSLRIAKEFTALGVDTKAQLPIHPGNLAPEKIVAIYSDLCRSNIAELLLMRTFPVGRGQRYLNKNLTTRAEIVKSIELFKTCERVDGTRIRLQCALKHLYGTEELANPCDLMHESFGINFQGRLLISAWANDTAGLPLSDDFVLGDICEESFYEISRKDKFRRYMNRLDENIGHCKIFAFMAVGQTGEDSIFGKTDPLYS